MYRRFGKRIFDLLLVVPFFLIVCPLLLLMGLTLKLVNKGSDILFRQERPGKNCIIFNVFKFKTMTEECDANGKLLPDAKRLTSFGKFLRSTSMDELPQLINVLKGDMSLVGPRPLLIKYLPLYTKDQARRHDVSPGITGWAQVNGRNANTWEHKFELDTWYVDHVSFSLDLKILFMTIKKVIIREGISKKGEATTVAFNGKN